MPKALILRRRVPEMSLEKVKLDNGLTVYNDRIPGARTNDVSVFVPYGSVNEQPGNEGVAHVFEHCVHLETDDFKDRQALRSFDKTHGMETNANTYYTRTLYYANGMEIEPNIARLSQILQHPHFPEDEVEHELKAVRREMAMRLDSPSEVHGLVSTLAMFGHPYGRSVGGYHDKIDFDVPTLKELHAKYYKLGRMSLVVTGAAKLEDVVRLAEQYFQADADPTFAEEPVPPATPGTDLRTGFILNDSQNVRVRLGYPLTPEFRDRFNKNRLAFSMANAAIADAALTALRYDKGVSYDGGTSFVTYNHPNAWSFRGGATTDADKVGTALDTLAEVLERDGKSYDDTNLAGIIASNKYAINSVITSNEQRNDGIVGRLESYREPEDIHAIVRRLDKVSVANVRAAIDEIVGYVGSRQGYVHLTGTKQAIGEVDRVIKLEEVA